MCMYCPREFKDDDKDMLDHVKQCLLKSQVKNKDSSNDRDKGIDKDEMKNLMKPKIMASLEKMKSKVLEDMKPFN